MRRSSIPRISLVSATLLGTVTVAAQAATPVASWSTTKAAATATAQIKIPFCKVFPASRDCVAGKLVAGSPHGAVAVIDAKCRQAAKDALGRQQFSCAYTTLNDYSEGKLMVTVLGATTFRWKTL